MREFFFKSNNELPNTSVFIKEDSFVSINLQSILFRVLRRVILLSSNKGQWRKKWDVDSISIPQLQRGLIQFWRLRLNLCSRRWLSPRQSRIVSLIPLWLQQLKKPYGVGLINLRILPSKIPKLSALRTAGSSLFHSMTADGKKVFLKKLCLISIRGIQSTFLVAQEDVFSGIKLKR